MVDHLNFRRIDLLDVLLLDQGLSRLCVKFWMIFCKQLLANKSIETISIYLSTMTTASSLTTFVYCNVNNIPNLQQSTLILLI